MQIRSYPAVVVLAAAPGAAKPSTATDMSRLAYEVTRLTGVLSVVRTSPAEGQRFGTAAAAAGTAAAAAGPVAVASAPEAAASAATTLRGRGRQSHRFSTELPGLPSHELLRL